jgi:hypothetical protein
LPRRRSDLCKALRRDTAATELRSPRFCGCEGSLGSLRDGLGLLLSNCGQDVHDEPIRLGHIDSHELDTGFHEVRDEGDVAGETVQLGDHQGSAMFTAELEGCSEGGPIISLAAFDLKNFLYKRPVSTIQESGDGGALRFEA